MLYLRVFSDEIKLIEYNIFNSIEEYAMYKLLIDLKNKEAIEVKMINDSLNIDTQTIRSQLENLVNKGIITLEAETNNSNIFLNVAMINKQEDVNGLARDLYEAFYLSEVQIKQIIDVSTTNNQIDTENFKVAVINTVRKLTLEQKEPNFIINSQNDLEKFLKLVAPHEIFYGRGCLVSNRDIQFIYAMLFEKKYKKELVNLAIDYTIKTNINGLFNSEFALKTLNVWHNQEITSVSEAMEYITKRNNEVKKRQSKTKYIEPQWDDVKVETTKASAIKELEGLINDF